MRLHCFTPHQLKIRINRGLDKPFERLIFTLRDEDRVPISYVPRATQKRLNKVRVTRALAVKCWARTGAKSTGLLTEGIIIMQTISKAANWFGDRASEHDITSVFAQFKMFGEVPVWADQFARSVLNDLEANRQVNLNSYCLLNLSPRVGGKPEISFTLLSNEPDDAGDECS